MTNTELRELSQQSKEQESRRGTLDSTLRAMR